MDQPGRRPVQRRTTPIQVPIKKNKKIQKSVKKVIMSKNEKDTDQLQSRGIMPS
jgi:hypothetical protein